MQMYSIMQLKENKMLWRYLIWCGITLLSGVVCEDMEVFVESGSQAVLPCGSSTLTSSAAVIIWTKNGCTVFKKGQNGLEAWGQGCFCPDTRQPRCFHSDKNGLHSLRIKDITEEDGGVYTCIVDNGMTQVEKTFILRVIKVSISPSVPLEGHNISVSCKVNPWPKGAMIRWKLDDKPYTPVNQNAMKETFNPHEDMVSNSAWTGRASQRLTGRWTCVVDYQGKGAQAAQHVSVRGITQPSNDSTKVYAAVGSAASLPCVFAPGLIPSDPTWEKWNEQAKTFDPFTPPPPSSTPSPMSSLDPWDMSAMLLEVGLEDGGTYRCSGTIQGHRLTRTQQLIVAKVESNTPSARRGSETLTCHLSDPSEITDYEWAHMTYDLYGTQTVSSPVQGKVIQINRATQEDSGEWICHFYRKKVLLGTVTYHVQQTSSLTGELAKPSETGESNKDTGTIILLSVLLMVLLLVLFQMFKNHQRKKRILQYPALESIVHSISNEREEKERNQPPVAAKCHYTVE